MNPDMMFELTKFRIEELHREAAQQRLAKRWSGRTTRGVSSPRGSRLGFLGFRSKTA